MFARACVLSLSLPFFIGAVGALDLDINNADSIKSTAKTLAGGIISAYKEEQSSNNPGPGQFGDPYYWWEAGAIWNSLIEYSNLTGDTQYDDLVSEALQFQLGETLSFMPPNQTKNLANEDQSFWGLAALTAAENGFQKPQEGEWLDFAKNVFDSQTLRWDNDTCGGGLRWQIYTFQSGYNYKNSGSNGNFFLLSARLAHLTGNQTYADWAEKTFDWMRDIGLVSDDYAVFDGTDAKNDCGTLNRIQWSYTSATFAEGAAVMYNATNGENKKWKNAVAGFVDSGSVFQDDETSVLVEVACEKGSNCNVDQRAFKGIAARSYARAAVAAPFVSDQLSKTLEATAKAAAKGCDAEDDDDEVECEFSWIEDGQDGEGLGENFTALAAVQGLLYKEGRAEGNNNSTGKAANQTGTPSGGHASTTGDADVPESTGAAGRIQVTAGLAVVAAAALAAVVGF